MRARIRWHWHLILTVENWHPGPSFREHLQTSWNLKFCWKNEIFNDVFQLNAAWTTSYTRWKAKMRCYQIRKRQNNVVLSPKMFQKSQKLHENVRWSNTVWRLWGQNFAPARGSTNWLHTLFQKRTVKCQVNIFKLLS